ncbi:hypothetical protein DUNSADRAFT_749 [Dunaliella salina]|uniref:Secreted protein n=1 Tax=Dunaliella salina TaxID=3046 RepID=A0ABQ7GY02_DUNSA|nr:hypothetical protein DUNSADRAFT_749 [Dunaliella salina]|eukprot:KAF5839463.1 hypothetical protein DUNSADRAFT_749 [Dunaliella salina]
MHVHEYVCIFVHLQCVALHQLADLSHLTLAETARLGSRRLRSQTPLLRSGILERRLWTRCLAGCRIDEAKCVQRDLEVREEVHCLQDAPLLRAHSDERLKRLRLQQNKRNQLFFGTHVKIGTIQRRSARPLRKHSSRHD